jgi:pectate lyase
VSGNIELTAKIDIQNPYITIDGSTAPNGGICLKGYGMQLNTTNVIIRHLRIRPGTNASPDSNDSIDMTPNCQRILIDHCSISWAQDENMSIYAQDVTIQWCIISEGLDVSGHSETHHSMGAFTTGQANRVSWHHNLFIHNTDRNPTLAAGVNDCINNVLYNGGSSASATPQDWNVYINFIKCWQKSGADTTYAINDASIRLIQNQQPEIMQAYVEGNIGPLRLNDTLPQNNCVYAVEQQYLVAERFAYTGSHPVTETSATDAKTAVLAGAGATLPKRDAVDTRVVADVDAATGAIIDSPNDVGGWPDLTV